MIHIGMLQAVTWECVHFGDAADWTAIRPALGPDVRIADFDCDSGVDILEAVGRAFEFPDYYRKNWNALDECLRDLSWLPGRGYVLVITGATALWSRDPQSAGALTESWLMAAESWAAEGVPFHLVFVW